MAGINVGINVIWDNQKQMQQAKEDILSLGKFALLSADKFGKSDAEISKSFAKMLPGIRTSSQALKAFSNEGYLAWVKFQKEVDEGAKGQQFALSKQLKNLAAGFDYLAKSSDGSAEKLLVYKKAMAEVSKRLEKVAKDNKSIGNSFSASGFLASVNKQKKATAEWGNEVFAVSQAMDSIAKKGQALEFVNSTGKQTKSLKLLREEYKKLQSQSNSLSMGKFNKTLQDQFAYAKDTKGEIEALKEKYKSLDGVIRNLITSGDTANLETYKQQLASVGANLNKLEVASKKFDEGGFFTSLNKNTDAIENMDGRLAAVNSRMKVLRTTILKLTGSGDANEKQMKGLREEYAKLSTEQKNLQKESNGTGLRIKNLIKSFVSAQAIVWAVRTAFTKLINTFKDSAEVAAAAEETMNLFEVVFEGVGDSATEMAKNMSKSFGVAQSSISQGLSTLGDFAEGLGLSNQEALTFSATLSQRMMDVISFKNVVGNTTDILKNLASGLAGNTENFRTLGYVIKESSVNLWLAKHNMDKFTGTALELGKVQARAALFMEQSSNAAGDMARTFDSTVNIARRLTEATKQLNENMGVDFNKVITPIRKVTLGIVENWNLASAAKKAYADIDITGSKTNNLAHNNKTVKAYYNASKTSQVEKGQIKGGFVLGKYIGETAGKVDLMDFSKIVDALGGSIEDTVASLDDLNISYKQSYIETVKSFKKTKENERLDSKANEALDNFIGTLNSWSTTGLKSSITPWQKATGTVPSDTKLATTYQTELKSMYETAFNSLIQAQNSKNKDLEEKANIELNTIVKQYNEAQKVIDQASDNAKKDAANASALKDATANFKTSMGKITSNIAAMATNIDSIMRNANVSASMMGQDNSMVSIAQNRATALVGVKANNFQASQNFAAYHGEMIDSYKSVQNSGYSESASKNMPGFNEWLNLIKEQAESLKKTNTYYDLLEINAKDQLGFSDAENELSSQMVKNYQGIVDTQLTDLKQKLKEGEITQGYYDAVKKIWNGHITTLKNLSFSGVKDALSGLGSMSLTKGVNVGTGLYSGAENSYKENLAQLDLIKVAVLKLSKDGISKDDAATLNNSLIAIKKSYKADKNQAFLDTTGISSSPDIQLFANLKDILKDVPSAINKLFADIFGGIDLKGISDLIGSTLSGLLENAKDLFAPIGEAIGGMFSQGDENGDGKGPLAGVGAMFGGLGNVLGPITKALIYILSQFSVFDDALSIITDALASLEPLIDSFLAPLLVIIEPLISLLGDILTPILQVLFPIIKGIMLVLIPIIAAIDVLIVYMTTLGTVVKDIVTFKWGHIKKDAIAGAAKIVKIWDDMGDNLKEVVNSTLDTTKGLKSANKDYINAINDIMGKGLLTGQEALQLIAKENHSTYTGDNYKYLDKNSYNPYNGGGGTVNVGTISIDAKGKTMEQIFDEIRQSTYESDVTGGVSGL